VLKKTSAAKHKGQSLRYVAVAIITTAEMCWDWLINPCKSLTWISTFHRQRKNKKNTTGFWILITVNPQLQMPGSKKMLRLTRHLTVMSKYRLAAYPVASETVIQAVSTTKYSGTTISRLLTSGGIVNRSQSWATLQPLLAKRWHWRQQTRMHIHVHMSHIKTKISLIGLDSNTKCYSVDPKPTASIANIATII